jgi:hypothetical protein
MKHRPRALAVVGLALAAALCLGMGDSLSGGDKTPRRPSRNFTGTVTDRSMTTLNVRYINCEGRTAIKGYLGEMRVDLTFDKIEKVSFGAVNGGYVPGKVAFRNGDVQTFRFKDLTRCYGESNVGWMTVRLRDLREITLDAPPPEEKPKPTP